MSLRALLVIAIFATCLSTVAGTARADGIDSLRTMFGLSSFPNAQARSETVGGLPKDALPIPQPTGLAVVGSATGSYNGKVTSEVLFFEAQPGSVPDISSYEQLLTTSGWHSAFSMPNSVFAFPIGAATAPQTFCKAGMPTITVRSDKQYLVVRADAGASICGSMRGSGRIAPALSKAPYPVFTPPDGSTFVGSSQQTFNGNAHLAAIGMNSTLPASTILVGLAKQMTDAGWTAKTRPATDSDSQTFAIRDKEGTDWIAALTVVSVGNGQYLFTATAFKTTETGTSAVTAQRN